MKNLRSQLALLTLSVALFGIFGTVFYMTRSYIDDKKNYVVEVSSAAAPNIAGLISKNLSEAVSKTHLFETAMDDIQKKPQQKASARFLSKIFEGQSGISSIRIYRSNKLVHEIELEPSSNTEQDLVLPSVRTNFLFKGTNPDEIFYVAPSPLFDETGFYLFKIKNSFFQKAYELAPAFHPILIDERGLPFFQNSNIQYDATTVSTLLKNLNRGTVIAHENVDTEDTRKLLVLASVQETMNASLLLQVPMMSAADLIKPVFRSNFSFLLILFFVSVLLSALFALKVARPIEELTEASMKIAKGEWKVPVVKRGSIEMNRLVRAFGKMVAELQNREIEIQRANRELVRSERLAALGRFGAGIAHEVKNPLASVLGYAQLIRRKLPGSLEEKEVQYVDFIMDETKRASRIINDLLMFARQKPPELKAQFIRPVLEKAIALYRPQAESGHVDLQLNIDSSSETAQVRIDFEQFIQVIMNLISNALQALEDVQREDKMIVIQTSIQNQSAVIEVRDNGPGISEENLSKLFEPFFSTKEVGKGSGLGLALSLGIIELHQGKITVSSTLGTGTAFQITVPHCSPSVG